MPHVVIVNNLNHHIKLLQPVGYTGEFRSEFKVLKGTIRPFHFPDILSERKLLIDIEGPYCRTMAFNIDFLGRL